VDRAVVDGRVCHACGWHAESCVFGDDCAVFESERGLCYAVDGCCARMSAVTKSRRNCLDA
jgi:hypothetical protein